MNLEYTQFINDILKQLKSGMEVYVFEKTQVEELETAMKKLGVNLAIEKIDYYYKLTPDKKIKKYFRY